MKYRVLVGINYTPAGTTQERRAEPGDIVADLPLPPAGIAKWIARGLIEAVAEPVAEPEPTGGD